MQQMCGPLDRGLEDSKGTGAKERGWKEEVKSEIV